MNHYYFCVIDPDWGPAFLKVCGYAPYAIKLCLNGHEWAKRQLQQRRFPFLRRDEAPRPPPGAHQGPAHPQAWRGAQQEHHAADPGHDLSSVLLGDAVEDGIILANPALQVGRRGRKRADAITTAERQKKIRPMSYEQIAAFLAVADAECSRTGAVLCLLLADTGVRPGEALAVRWEDVNLNERTLRVERALSAGRIEPTKTEQTRTVDLSPRLTEALSRYQAGQEAEALMANREPGSSPRRTGHRSTRQESRTRSGGCSAGPGFCASGPYDLRHTYATHLLASGAPITYVAA